LREVERESARREEQGVQEDGRESRDWS